MPHHDRDLRRDSSGEDKRLLISRFCTPFLTYGRQSNGGLQGFSGCMRGLKLSNDVFKLSKGGRSLLSEYGVRKASGGGSGGGGECESSSDR